MILRRPECDHVAAIGGGSGALLGELLVDGGVAGGVVVAGDHGALATLDALDHGGQRFAGF